MKDLKIFAKTIEDDARKQIYEVAKYFPYSKIRIMPDAHAGVGCVIGFTADMKDKVIPNLIGVDIGCGMRVVELGLKDVDYTQLDEVIREYVPSGMNVHTHQTKGVLEKASIEALRCKADLKNMDWLLSSMGTLGGGNHFIEIDEDDIGSKYLVIHTGSRNLGSQVAKIYQRKAVKYVYGQSNKRDEIIAKLKASGRDKEIEGILKTIKKPNIPKDLCYLVGQDADDYIHDMKLCQWWAYCNRTAIRKVILEHTGLKGIREFESVHNYIKNGMIRKGAISAKKGESVIIPLNMRDGCIIGHGKGNSDWNYSAPHGAGRTMSRAKAKAELGIDEFSETMKGIYTTCVSEKTLDEAPMAYKPCEEIIKAIEPTVDIEKIIIPKYNFKAD
jgi:RNA-splicing ligase RtcB